MIRNFLFHRVSPERDKLWDPMDVHLFEDSIKYITNNYNVVLIEDLVFSNALYSKTNYATIMFDDGYKDNIEYAADILEKYKCKASFYVVTDCIEKNIPTWTHIIEYIFQFSDISVVDMSFDYLPENLKYRKFSNYKERIDYANLLKPLIKRLAHENRNEVIDYLLNCLKEVEFPKLMMDWDDLMQLKNNGHYIGSHTVSHSMLGTMTDEAEIRRELIESAMTILDKLGHLPISISYPVGSYNNKVKELSREVGYKIGLAVKQNIHNPQKEDVFEISRIELYNEPWWKTKLRITNRLEDIKALIRYK